MQTPNLDRFASMGTRFTNCFTQASVCSQSRCSIFTGQYPHVSGHRSLNNLLKPYEPNLFRSMKDFGGYHVAYLSPRGDLFAVNSTEDSVDDYGFLNEKATLPDFKVEPGFFRLEATDSSNFTAANPPSADNSDEDRNSIWNRLYYGGLRDETLADDFDAKVIAGALKWLECPPNTSLGYCSFLWQFHIQNSPLKSRGTRCIIARRCLDQRTPVRRLDMRRALHGRFESSITRLGQRPRCGRR